MLVKIVDNARGFVRDAFALVVLAPHPEPEAAAAPIDCPEMDIHRALDYMHASMKLMA